MFGGAKPNFGTAANTTNFSGFGNASTTTAFGQSAFSKPAASAFGATPAFGAQQTTPSLFGQPAAPTQQTGLFGAATTSGAFGSTTTAPSTFGGFTQQQQNTSIFGATQNTTNASMFGQSGTSAFGAAVKPGGLTGFGQPSAAQPSASLFGQQGASTSTTGFGGFGQTSAPTTNVFGSGAASAFGQPQASAAAVGGNTGTALVKYQPTVGTDTLMKSGQPSNISTKQHCITAMKEYEQKSLEELRMEDYLAGRKGPQGGAPTGGFFGGANVAPQNATPSTGLFSTTSQPTTNLFGQTATTGTENKGLFGQNSFGQPTSANTFGSNTQQNSFMGKPFGPTNTTGFGATSTDTSNPFGAKPAFGQAPTTGLFGQTSVANTAPAFGQTNSGGFGGFATTAGTQQPSLFGNTQADANKPTFGLGTPASGTNTGFTGFGSVATSTAGSGGLFGAKTATGFGQAPSFGATSTSNTGFGSFPMNNTATSGAGLFNSTLQKPATSGFTGFGTQTSAPLSFNAGNTGGSLFGNTAAKPGVFSGNTSLGTATSTAGGLFGNTQNSFGANNSLGGGFLPLGNNNTLSGGLSGTPQQQPAALIHQQILAKVTSPYGDTPIFKDLKRNDEADATRATNPAAQQAVLDSSSNQFKIDAKASSSVIKVKPISSSLNRKSLFDGLEQYDASVESFSLKPSAKRLVINPKNKQISTDVDKNTSGNNSNVRTSHSNLSAPNNDTFSNSVPLESQNALPSEQAIETDTSRRESWLHQPVRQHNIPAALDNGNGNQFNSTLSELVPRKPLETYRRSSGTRMSVSTIPENPFEDQTNSISRRDTITFTSEHANESILSNRSSGGQEERLAIENATPDHEPHPTGITLRRVGYYTIPSLDDLKSYITEDGSCIVPNFTIGREGYGNVYFGKEMDVSGINLDEIVHFRNKEIIVYPDDDKKPPIGSGLNRDAQVTLDQVWPHDKTKHEPIKDPQRLDEMDWEGKLRRVCDKNDTRFIEYRPETGSWVFRVKHFSKYGLSDSDEEGDEPTDAKKAKFADGEVSRAQPPNGSGQMTLSSLKNAQKISEEAARALDPRTLAAGVASGFYPMDESAEFMFMDKTQFFQGGDHDFSIFESSKSIKSPTAALVKEVNGNDTHRFQLMKASLFEEPDLDNKSVASELNINHVITRNYRKSCFGRDFMGDAAIPTDGSSETSSQFDFGQTSPPIPASSSASVLSILREVQSETSSPAPDSESTINVHQKTSQEALDFVLTPDVAPIKSFAFTVHLSQSIAYSLCKTWSNDLGFFKSHSFKTGFGPQNSLIVPTTHNNRCNVTNFTNLCDALPKVFKPRAANDLSPTILQHIKITSTQHYTNFKDSIVPHLEIALSHVQSNEVQDSDCIWFQSDSGTDLIVKHLEEAIKMAVHGDAQEYAVSVWSLLLALWGDHEQLEGQDSSSHFAVMYRRNLFSEWLENTLVEKDMLSKQISKHTYLEHMLDLLMCHRVNEACELAFSYDDCNLALILAQLSSGPVVRQLVEDQLASWHMTKADKHISTERLKMFMMVAGVPLMESEHGPINILENINWIKVLALQLWYFTSPTSSITDALLAYEKSFTTKEFYSQPPTPVYSEHLYSSGRIVYDLRYHILQLYSKRSYPLESLLNPATHTDDPMDYRLSWILLQTLEALGYNQCPELCESQLHVGFAAQLENNGLWEWAIFVLMHIKNRNHREIAVQNVIYRYVSVSKEVALTEQEKFVIHRLGVPEKWIDYAKAVKAGSKRQYHLQAKYLLKAKQWALAHEVIYEHIAPDAIINDNLSYLHNLMGRFECTEHRTNVRVPNWSNQGQIFLDYMDITEKFKQIKTVNSTADIEARWENLKPQLAELCSRINLLPCPTAKHRLCQSEIAQSLAYLIRGMLIVCPNLQPCMIIKIALERLPLPQEFAKKDLRALLGSLVDYITKVTVSGNSRNLAIEVSSK